MPSSPQHQPSQVFDVLGAPLGLQECSGCQHGREEHVSIPTFPGLEAMSCQFLLGGSIISPGFVMNVGALAWTVMNPRRLQFQERMPGNMHNVAVCAMS